MNKVMLVLFVSVVFCVLSTVPVSAVPTLQVFSPDYTSVGTSGSDEDTWFVNSSSFDLTVVGAFKRNVSIMTNVTLVVSVPNGSQGQFTIIGSDGILDPIILSSQRLAGGDYYSPVIDATTNILNDDLDLDGYADKSEFLPAQLYDDQDGILIYDGGETVTFNSHYPFKDDVSDFLLFDLGTFEDLYDISNYSTEESIELNAGSGQEKTYSVSFSGFDQVHFDAYGFINGEWVINPASHDTTAVVPAPGALLLGSIGMSLVGWLRRRRTL